ncbi:hypothetical protein F5882DRAFT_154323 [Hyaloscypha sp. PMI_1271]|nr:hypothetical protein F5882DRAFT_154323 [Hyaloscypha sp. PMI_1271]
MPITARHPSQYHINKLACGNLREASAVSSRIAEEVSVDHRTRMMTPKPRPFLPPLLHQTSFGATSTMTCISPARSQIHHQRRWKQTATLASPMPLNGEAVYRFCTCIMSRYPECLDGHKRPQDRISNASSPHSRPRSPIRLATAGTPGTPPVAPPRSPHRDAISCGLIWVWLTHSSYSLLFARSKLLPQPSVVSVSLLWYLND